MMTILCGVFLATLFLGFPVALCLGLTSLAGLWIMDVPFLLIPQRIFQGINSFTLLAVPLFVMMGELMNKCGITQRLIDFSYALVGRIPGGLAHTNVAASMFFGGISGSAVADTAAFGSILVPGMVKSGYDPGFSAAITAASSTMGPIIPPSILMVIMGVTTGISVGGLFVAGIIPGLLMGIFMMIYSYILAVKHNYPRDTRPFSLARLAQQTWRAMPALLAPGIIMGGILLGIFTPTEASAVSVLYAFCLGLIFKSLKWSDIIDVLKNTTSTTAVLLLIIGTANIFAWVLSADQIPTKMAHAMLSISSNKIIILLLLNILLLFVGMFMEGGAAIIILAPTLLAVATQVGIEPLHFGMIMVLNMAVGLLTPPLGVCLFVVCGVTKLPLGLVVKSALPLVALEISILLMVTYIPPIALYLPKIMGYL